MVLNDQMIRSTLMSSFNPDELVIEELLCSHGDARIDIAVFNHGITGYEIKSDVDSLSRLKSQEVAYNRFFDMIILVTTPKHIRKAKQVLPRFWGISCALRTLHGIEIEKLRDPRPNKKRDPSEVASLLWKSELISIIQELGFENLSPKATRFDYWSCLVRNVPDPDLTRIVIKKIAERGAWRVDRQRKLHGDLSQRAPKSRDFQAKRSRSRSPIYICHHN